MKRSRLSMLALLAPIVASACLATHSAFADSNSAAVEAFSRVSEISNVAISPSGQRVAYQRRGDDEDLILVLDVASGELVFSMGIQDSAIGAIRFIGERSLMFVYHWRHHYADFGRGHTRRIKFLDLDNGDLDDLEAWSSSGWEMNPKTSSGTVVGISDDYTHFLMPRWEGRNARFYSLFEYSMEHGAGNLALARGTSDTIDWFVGSGGKPLARVDFDEDDDLYTVFAYRDGEPEVLFQETAANPQMRVLALTAEQDGLMYMARLPGADDLTLHVLNLADGSRSEPIASFGSGGVFTNSDRRAVAIWKAASLVDEYEFPDSDVERFFRKIQASLPGEPVELVSFTDDFNHVVVRLSRQWGKAYYLLFSQDAQKPVLIAKEETGTPNDSVRFDYNYEFVASDGHVVRARLTRNGDMDRQRPLIVVAEAPIWLEQYFAAHGFVVVQPVSRDLQVGRAFIPEGAVESAAQLHTDLNDVARHLVDKGIADPARVCVIGFLRGAFLATLAASQSPETYRCVASVNGYFDLERPARRIREGVKDDSYRVRLFEARFAVDASDKDSLIARSPINHVGEDFAPTLLVYFKKSDKLLESEAKAFSRTLKARGAEHKVKAINTDDLTLNDGKTRRQVLTAVSDFVFRHVSGKP